MVSTFQLPFSPAVEHIILKFARVGSAIGEGEGTATIAFTIDDLAVIAIATGENHDGFAIRWHPVLGRSIILGAIGVNIVWLSRWQRWRWRFVANPGRGDRRSRWRSRWH